MVQISIGRVYVASFIWISHIPFSFNPIQTQRLSTQYESQKAQEEMTQAERDDLELRRKRAEGTPCTPENFAAWKKAFDEEMEQLKAKEAAEAQEAKSKKSKAKADKQSADISDKAGRLTGFQQFSDKAFNLEALEAAAENAQTDPDEQLEEEDEGAIQEELFDVDDEDLDDLDFDDDDDEDEDVDI